MKSHIVWRLNIKCRLALRARALLDISQFQCLVWRLKRVPAGPECYCSCVNSPGRGSHSYISYYIHEHQPPRSPPQNAQKLNFKRHPIDTTGNALVLIYPNIVFYQNDLNIFIGINFLWFLIKYLPYLWEENILDCAVHKSKISFILDQIFPISGFRELLSNPMSSQFGGRPVQTWGTRHHKERIGKSCAQNVLIYSACQHR